MTGWGAPNFDAWYAVLVNKPVSGHVTLGNYPRSPAGVSVTVQFYSAGTATLVDTQIGTLDSSGNFIVRTPAKTGSYDVYVKASHWLRRKTVNQALTYAGLSGLSFSLINGDIDGNNTVGSLDFSKLKLAFGSFPGDPNWNPDADLDGSGSVGLGDFSILKVNFGQIGD